MITLAFGSPKLNAPQQVESLLGAQSPNRLLRSKNRALDGETEFDASEDACGKFPGLRCPNRPSQGPKIDRGGYIALTAPGFGFYLQIP